jgi:hypothetical protein
VIKHGLLEFDKANITKISQTKKFIFTFLEKKKSQPPGLGSLD